MSIVSSVRTGIANAAARAALRVPAFERLIAEGCKNVFLRRRLHLGAIAVGYSRVLRRRELRVADMGSYKFYVNVCEPLGINPFFFGESGAVWIASELIRSGDTCIDAGANVGHYTFLTASKVGPLGRVFAFEPNPEFTEIIRRSIALNGYESFVSVEPNALWNQDGERLSFFVSTDPGNSGTSSIIKQHIPDLSTEHPITVTTTTLDTFARERKLDSIRLLKIDVERAEQQLLEGAHALLSRAQIDFLIVEMYSGSQSQVILEGHGYQGFRLDSVRKKLVPIQRVMTGLFTDYLFVSPSHYDSFLNEGAARWQVDA